MSIDFDEEIPHQLSHVVRRGPFELSLPSTHCATCVYFGVVTHVCMGEGLAYKVGDPITELIVTHHDDPSLILVRGIADVKYHATSIAMVRYFGGINAIWQEE